MNEERKPPQSTAELAYGRIEGDPQGNPSISPDGTMEDTRSADTPGTEGGRMGNGEPMSRGDGGLEPAGQGLHEDESTERAPLLDAQRSGRYSTQWRELQAKFVEEPKDAVREADGLVAEVIQALATSFAEQRKQLEDQWDKGSDVSTEDLRVALIQYRSFFERLLAA